MADGMSSTPELVFLYRERTNLNRLQHAVFKNVKEAAEVVGKRRCLTVPLSDRGRLLSATSLGVICQ